MTNPEFGVPAVQPPMPGLPSTSNIGGPCAPVRAEVDVRCVDAERLLAAAKSHQQTLHEARHQHAEVVRMRESDALFRDRRRLADEKKAAQAEYHAVVARGEQGAVQDAAAVWLRRMDQLNRQARAADDRADDVAQRVMELERGLPGLEMAADAARISAESAQVACLEARRTLAACEEDAGRTAPSSVGMQSTAAIAPASEETATASETAGVAAAARALMRGDRQTLLGLALRLAEETGFEAGRLQLLLLELREQIVARARDDFAFAFPANHPFWSQFPDDAASAVAASLASMGYRFDGKSGWTDGHAPQVRDLALALSYCGYDPRSLRRPAGHAAIDALWQGATVRTDEYLLMRAPDLALSQLVTLLGTRAGKLAELWDMWGRVRPLLMRAG